MDFLKMIKEAATLKSKVKEVEKKMVNHKFEVSLEGIVITANAKQDILDIKISPQLYEQGMQKIEKVLLKALQETSQKAQKIMAEETKKIMGDLNNSPLKNMLGG